VEGWEGNVRYSGKVLGFIRWRGSGRERSTVRNKLECYKILIKKTEPTLTSDNKFCPVRDECVPLLEV